MVLVLPPFENDLPIPTLSLFVKMLKFITLDENDILIEQEYKCN